MMKKNIFDIVIILFTVHLAGCKENTALEYENEPALYFENVWEGQRDSVAQTFFIKPTGTTKDTVRIEILTMGFPASEDRSFLLEQVNIGKPGAAEPGKHYVAFDDVEIQRELIIPAGAVRKSFPLIVLYDPSLDLDEVRLELKVKENENFKVGINEWSSFVVKISAKAIKPIMWDTYWRYIFGETWGSRKMKFIIDNTGFSNFDGGYIDSDYSDYLAAKVQQKLLEYNANPDNLDRPLREADGTLVEFN